MNTALHESVRASCANNCTGSGHNYALLGLVVFLFFAWGFVTVLNDPLIAKLKGLFQLRYAEAMLQVAGAMVSIYWGLAMAGRFIGSAVLAIGLANSVMFPAIFTLALEGLGHALIVPACCYMMIAAYGFLAARGLGATRDWAIKQRGTFRGTALCAIPRLGVNHEPVFQSR